MTKPVSGILNAHPYPAINFRFQVLINNLPMGFSRISNMEEGIETEALQVGGINDHVINLRRPCSGERVLVLERGLSSRGLLALLNAARLVPGETIFNDIIIICYGGDRKIQGVFLVQGAMVRKFSYTDLDASGNNVLIQRMELVYEKMEQSVAAANLLSKRTLMVDPISAISPRKVLPTTPSAASLAAEEKALLEAKAKLDQAKRTEAAKQQQVKNKEKEIETLNKELSDSTLTESERTALTLKKESAEAEMDGLKAQAQKATEKRQQQEAAASAQQEKRDAAQNES